MADCCSIQFNSIRSPTRREENAHRDARLAREMRGLTSMAFRFQPRAERKAELKAAAATMVGTHSGEQGSGGLGDAKDDKGESATEGMDEMKDGFVNNHKNQREGDGKGGDGKGGKAAKKGGKAVKWPPVGDQAGK